MDEDADSPADANSFDINEVLHRNILALNKKRKLETEFLNLPTAKYKRYVPFHNFESEEGGSNDGSNPESAQDSNSFMNEVTDSAMSALYGSSTLQSSDAKLHGSRTTYGFSSSWGTSSSENQMDSSDGKVEENINLPPDGPINLRLILEEQLLEFGSLEYGHDSTEQCADNGTEVDIYSSSGATGNPKSYVLSSGRWNIEQESAQITTRKPTIDQEFEQYFSMLML